MPRPSRRRERRENLAAAFETCLARLGVGSATIAAVAEEAGVAPGLIHHHFADREDLLQEVLRGLARRFRRDLPREDDPVEYLALYATAALGRRGRRRQQMARAWVGLFAEAVGSRGVRDLLRRALSAEIARVEHKSREAGLPDDDARTFAAGVVATIVGSLALGALLPDAAPGFAAPWLESAIRGQVAAVRGGEGADERPP